MDKNIVKPTSINYSQLLENSVTTTELSESSDTKLVHLLNNEFTEHEQRLYVANLWMYMNYHPTNDFPINLEDVFKMLGFANKENCKKTLKSNFIETEDYKLCVYSTVVQSHDGRINTQKRKNGKFVSEKVMLNVECFKGLCMIARTEKGKAIRKYYVKLENINNKIVSEELKEQKEKNERLLKEKDELLQLEIANKPLERHNILLREFGSIGSIVYIVKVKSFVDGSYIIKIGESRVGVKCRYNEHRKNYGKECVILDCFLVNKSKNFETFLHDHKDISKYRVKDLIGHESENELFLIGKGLSYQTFLNIVNQNIKYYNDNHIELEKLRMENANLQIVQELNADFTLKNFITHQTDNYTIINNKLNELSQQMNKLQDAIVSIAAPKIVSNFNQPLISVGPRLQQIDPDTFQLVKVYDTVTECIKQNNNIYKRPSINKAIANNTVYCNYRWMFVDRTLDPNIVVNIKATKKTRPQYIGYIAKLNSDKTEIIEVYLDRKTASVSNNYRSESSLDSVVKKCKMSNNNYYILYDDLQEELRNKYSIPILYKNGIGKYDSNNCLVKEFTCKLDCVFKETISDKSLTKSIKNKLLYNGYYYDYLQSKVRCALEKLYN